MSASETDRSELAAELVDVARELYEVGLIGGVAGNLSARLDERHILITPSGLHKGHLSPDATIAVALAEDGRSVPGVSVELPLHRQCYLEAESVGAVVHTHAPALTAIGIRGMEIARWLPEITAATGQIRTVPFIESGTEELGRVVADATSAGAGLVLLRNHGAVAVGIDIRQAADRMELGELSAYSVLLGEDGGRAADADRLRKLMDRMSNRGLELKPTRPNR